MPDGRSTSGQSLEIKKLRFPERWYESDDRPLSFIQQLEVRKLSNSSDGEFFFAALPHGDWDYSYEFDRDKPKPKYSQNSFAVNFNAGLRVRVATQQEWESASRIVTKSRYASPTGGDESEIEYRGKKFQKAGKYSSGGSLSPRGKWLAIFSYTGEKKRDLFMDGGSVHKGDLFWQIYDTTSGEKVFEWQARNVKGPAELTGPVVWLEERYFLFPQDINAQNFLVVTLPEFVPEKNPITFQLPSRKDENGRRVPAPANHPAWTPLIPLTKEQAAEITAPQPTQLEVRLPRGSSSGELLLAIREEVENRTVNRQQRDGAGDYNFRLFSTYYYAVSIDDPSQNRTASKEEWERARSLRTGSALFSLDKLNATEPGKRREYRFFPKTGAVGGSVLAFGEWIAIFSYTPDAHSDQTGKMFVDIFEFRPGNKYLATEFPYAGSPIPLFNGAVWVEGGYLILPLNTSFESFALWKLP